jgi:hypothetical protein
MGAATCFCQPSLLTPSRKGLKRLRYDADGFPGAVGRSLAAVKNSAENELINQEFTTAVGCDL